jgi:chromosome segregation ATPase
LRVFSAYLHKDEATPHLHIDFVPYTTGSKRGLDTRVSMKQALAELGFKGGSRSENEWNQWVNAEKEQLAIVMERHGIEWEKKDTHEEHLSVLDFKKKMRTKEVAELEQEKNALTSENAELASEIAEGRTDYKLLKEDIVDAEKSAQEAKERAEEAEKQAEICEKNLAILQPIIDSANKEVKEFKGKVDAQLPPAGMVELASSYRKKVLPLFVEMKNKIAALGASLYKVTQELEQLEQERKILKKENKVLWEDNNRLYEMCDDLLREKSDLLEIKTMFDRVVRVLGDVEVFGAIQKDKAREQMETELELQRQKAEPPKEKSVFKKLEWAKGQSEEHNTARMKKKTKNHGMER